MIGENNFGFQGFQKDLKRSIGESKVCYRPSRFVIDIDRSQKVKDAQTEAAKEIKEYRVKKEKEFKEFEAQVRGH